MQLVPEEFAVVERRFCILIDDNDDRLDVMVAVPLARRLTTADCPV